jgi:hypothetical protein
MNFRRTGICLARDSIRQCTNIPIYMKGKAMNRSVFVSLFIVVFHSYLLPAAEEKPTVENMPPVVVKTVPQAGDKNIDPKITEIKVTFSKEMTDKTWSWAQISDDTFPKSNGQIHYLADRKTCVMPVKLEPGKTYVVWINSANLNNFKDKNGQSAVPYLLVFETRKK